MTAVQVAEEGTYLSESHSRHLRMRGEGASTKRRLDSSSQPDAVMPTSTHSSCHWEARPQDPRVGLMRRRAELGPDHAAASLGAFQLE